MNYGTIKCFDIADGPGVRISLFVSGCRNHCEGCFQPETWDFNFGHKYDDEVENEIVENLKFNKALEGLTLLGGDPMEPENQRALLPLVKRVKTECPEKNIWLYTGYDFFKDIKNPEGKRHTEVTDEFIKNLDCVVDGPFVLEKKDITLLYRGSSNQRIISLNGYELPDLVKERYK